MGIRLSQKHGVNPSLEQCFVCLKDVGIILFGAMRGDAEAPRRVCLPNNEPCAECRRWMEQGVILISVRDGEPDHANPYRTGGWVVVRDEAIKRWELDPDFERSILQRRMAFIEDAVWDRIGLPRGEAKPETRSDQ